jgi:preprotein translocase subunit SecA
MFSYLAKRIFGTKNDRVVKSLQPLVARINELGVGLATLTNDELLRNSNSLRERVAKGESLNSVLPESFSLVREVGWRVLSMRHFDVQLIGGMVLHNGNIAEMKTGEGKTLVATLPAYLNALSGKGVHIVTVNDYLAKRDAEWMGKLYRFLGLSVGVVYHNMREEDKKKAYDSDITYGQNNEFGFDFLRDNMKFSLEEMVQRKHNFAIVDEVDSILIDEARTPLIISGPAEESTELYIEIDKLIPRLKDGMDYEIDLKSKNPTLTDEGILNVESLLQIENLFDPKHINILHHVNQALRAHKTMSLDVDYVVNNGEVVIVDEFTGRLMPGRRYSKGLHQAIEAKEKVRVNRESQTLASITFQNFFRMYDKLSGMTGTADTESVEFKKIYDLDVVVIPTHRPLSRQDMSDLVFKNRSDKYNGVIDDIVEIHCKGQPILVGTISIDQSEILAKMLIERGVTCNVLNAKQHEREAEIIAQAGRFKAVTISTNMAGRGTDILLGGNPEFLAFAETGSRDWLETKNSEILSKYKKQCEDERLEVLNAGGLFIMGTERHESRRIDNQLRGRAGRQGDPGASRFYVSLQDDLMIRFGGEKLQQLMSMPILGWEDGVAIDSPMVSKRIEDAQKRVEALHFDSRKYVTDMDDVMNKQRQVVYNQRLKIFKGEDLESDILNNIEDILETLVLSVCEEQQRPISWDLDKIKEGFNYIFNTSLELPSDLELSQQKIFDYVREIARENYLKLSSENKIRIDNLKEVILSQAAQDKPGFDVSMIEGITSYDSIIQRGMLEALDNVWNLHLRNLDELREGIGLRAYGQKNPLYEYQQEAFNLFQLAINQYKEDSVRRIFYVHIFDAETFIEMIKVEHERRERFQREFSLNIEEGSEEFEEENSKQLGNRKLRRKKRK